MLLADDMLLMVHGDSRSAEEFNYKLILLQFNKNDIKIMTSV